jgi:hypothetical protein
MRSGRGLLATTLRYADSFEWMMLQTRTCMVAINRLLDHFLPVSFRPRRLDTDGFAGPGGRSLDSCGPELKTALRLAELEAKPIKGAWPSSSLWRFGSS